MSEMRTVLQKHESASILRESPETIDGYTTFPQTFGYRFLLWTTVNLWDAIVLDIIWFCHDPHFVFKGTEDMVSDYHDYRFHIKGFFIGESLALAVCAEEIERKRVDASKRHDKRRAFCFWGI